MKFYKVMIILMISFVAFFAKFADVRDYSNIKSESSDVIYEEKEEVKYVYDSLTYDELVKKINKVLKSDLSGTANLYIDACLEYEVDPYIAVAISLLETGCKWGCTLGKNNVGGNMKCQNGSCSLIRFATLEDGINFFVKNLRNNYYNYGLTTVETIGPKYAQSKTWAQKVNKYIEEIKSI